MWKWLKTKYYQYELWTALYMLEPWEKAIFNSVILAGLLLTLYTVYMYLPEYAHYCVFVMTDYFPMLESYIPVNYMRRLDQIRRVKYGSS
ncbi:hypothetical protein MIR68_009736 [Amoeboaphelidium protococcarum]|nr:hypothetical protein MIR68_009736 [Amoeboaphelidium protococcarum]